MKIIVRGDSGFCRQRLLRWCERKAVGYVIGVARNKCLHKKVSAETAFAESDIKQRTIREFRYAADSWDIERHIVTRLGYGTQGTNPFFVVTNLDLPADHLYDTL